ncbi:uncharacterized protein [Littorina saxatilis]|uniref:Uncharacterized protein n=1 Tax=Littorina saxatilis TaxID=31220 RepID=A0AAN9B1T0_9CAEN
MEIKSAGRQFQRAATRHGIDLKRVLDRRTKVKISSLLSPESQKAMLMVQQDVHQSAISREQTVIPVVRHLTPGMHDVINYRHSDDVSDADCVGFGVMLDKVCTTRLHGDITDKNSTPRQSKKRALRSGDHLHVAMEVVEIVRHDCDDVSKEHYDDTDDEQEAIQRAADVSCQERCQAWVELHFDTDDTSSQSSAER